VRALDPQNEPLSGSLEVFLDQATQVTVHDLGPSFDCALGFLPEGVPNEGMGYVNGSIGEPIVFDLGSELNCGDGLQDYKMAAGTCDRPTTVFVDLLPLDQVTPIPTSLCLRKVGDDRGGLDLTDLVIDRDFLRFSVGRHDSVLRLPFAGGLPREADISSLTAGTPYRLVITVTDGNTVPVSAGGSFVSQGERTMLITNDVPPHPSITTQGRVECDRPEGGSVTLDATGSTDPSGGAITSYEWFRDFGLPTQQLLGTVPSLTTTLPVGPNAITLRVTDGGDGLSATAGTVVAVVDSTPPALACTAPAPVECSAPGGAPVSLQVTASDACSRIVVVTNSRTGGGADGSGGYPLGTTQVTFTATDASGNTANCTIPIVVRDTTPPALTLTSSPSVLWPPNHRMVPVQVGWQVSDACDPAADVALVSVASSEPDDAPGTGDGETTGDIEGAAPGGPVTAIQLRAERSGVGAGRTYTLTYRARDASGNAAPAIGVVTVPHDLGAGPEPLLMRLEPASPPGAARIYWSTVQGALAYDLIAGDLAQIAVENGRVSLGAVRVLASGLAATSFTEGAGSPLPAVGKGFFYLIQSRDALGESGYGTESVPWPREPASCDVGCP